MADRLIDEAGDILARLTEANAAFARHYDGARPARQPVHTLYWGAHRFDSGTFTAVADEARAMLSLYAPDAESLARAMGYEGDTKLTEAVYARVVDKLQREPLEDLRIDFEDGYGFRPDDEEDSDAARCAQALAAAVSDGSASAHSGIRVKPLTEPCAKRSIATLDRFVTSLVEARGSVPPGFRVTLPKVQVPEHVAAMSALLSRLEARSGLREGSLPLEFMVEVPQVFFDRDGRFQLPLMVKAGGQRLTAIALGVYDFTNACNVSAAWQSIDHRVCDLARGLMTLGAQGTHVQLCDGSTNVLPVEPHPRGDDLDEARRSENRDAVWRAWRLSHEHVRRSLITGYVQGWDLSAGQLVSRHAANARFYLESFDATAARMKAYLDKAVAATDGDAVLDDAATGQALLGFLHRARECGAVDDGDLMRAGLRREELGERSFATLLAGRRG